MDFLREEFLDPMGVMQEVLCRHLDLGSKTISELYSHKRGFTVATAKKFGKLLNVAPEQLLQMQALYDLKNDLAEYDVEPLKLQHNTKELLDLLRNAVSDTVDLKTLHGLFYDEFKNKPDLLKALFMYVPLNKTVKYMLDSAIGLSHLKKMYEYYVLKLGGKKHPYVEKILLDDDVSAMEKILNNEHYFNDPREYEKYLFYRVAFLRKKHELLKFINDPMQRKEVRQRAAYLYEFMTRQKVELDFKPLPVKLYGNSKRPISDVNEYGVCSGVDLSRYEQFVRTGNY
jgi:addiction module HigA family antidote